MDCQVLVLVAETFEQFADNEYETKTESSMLGMQHIVYRDTRQYPVLRVFMQTFFFTIASTAIFAWVCKTYQWLANEIKRKC